MKRMTVALLTAVFVLTGAVGTVAADDGATVDVVDVETFDVEDDVLEKFYGDVEQIVAEREDLELGEVANVTMDELLLMAGCDAPEPECLAAIGDMVGADQLVFGSIERSDDVLMFSLSRYDFDAGEMAREVSEQTLRGDRDWIDDGIPAVVEHLFFGQTATVHVEALGAPDAELRVNGENIGTGSATLEEATPGEVVVIARAAEDEEQKERLILRHGEERSVDLEFDDVEDIEEPAVAGPSLTPGLALAGTGVAGTVLGMVGQVRLSSADAEAQTLVGDRGALDPEDRARAEELDSRMTSSNTMRWLGFGTGLVGLAGGGFLLYRAVTHDGPGQTGDDIAETDLELDVGASDEGVNAGFRVRF